MRTTIPFLFEERYQPLYQNAPKKPSLGFLVAGYSSGQGLAEEWLIEIAEGICPELKLERPQEENGCLWYGQPEAIMRLLLGYGSGLFQVLQQMGVPPDQLDPAMQQITAALAVPLVIAPMPIQDTIDLAEFLVQLAIMYSRFSPGAPTVGGPVESADVGAADQDRPVPTEVTRPLVTARIEEPRALTSLGIDAGKVWAFMMVVREASER